MSRYAGKAVSNSDLTVLKRSVAEFEWRMILDIWPEQESQEAFALGSMLHCLALEPAKIWDRFAVAPDVDGRTREGKAAKAAFVEASKGKTVVSPAIADRVSMCHASLKKHAEALAILKMTERADAVIETPVYGQLHGVSVAGTPDLVVKDQGLIVDVKTTKDASPNAFRKSVADYGYHRQAAMYLSLVEQQYGNADRFIFVVVKSSPPYECAVYELDHSAISVGRSELQSLLEEFAYRTKNADWLAPWSKGVVTLQLPRWYRDELFVYQEEDSV